MHRGWVRLSALLAVGMAAALIVSSAPPAALGQASSPGSAGDPPSLFGDPPQSDALSGARSQTPQDQTVIRQRSVTLTPTALDALQGASAGGPLRDRVTLNLFEDVSLVGVRDRLESRSGGGFVWQGHVDGAAFSYVTLVVGDGVMVGNVVTPAGSYEIRYRGDGLHVVREIDPGAFPREAPPVRVPPPEDNKPVQRNDATTARDDGSLVDILVVYTAAARSAAGGTAAMNSLVDLVIADANSAYANSGITHRLRLVYRGEIAYTESGSGNMDLTRLRSTSDGFLDDVHTLRNTYGADLVSLIVQNLSNACGIGYLQGLTVTASFAPDAFSVVQSDCASGNHSLAHETGHNMGANHDWETEPDSTATNYNHGYVAPNHQWRTIMAYPDPCSGCPRLQYFSNPSVSYQGVAMGVAQGSFHPADNRATLNGNALVVSNFRQAVGGPQPVPTATATPTPVAGGPANNNFANAQTLTLPATVAGSSVGATVEPGETTPSCGGAGGSVWFRFTPSASGNLTVSTAGSGFDTTLALYTGASLGSLLEVACNDDFGGTTTSQISGIVTSGTSYSLRLAGFNGATGNYTLSVSLAASGPTATATVVPTPTTTPSPTGGITGGRSFSISPSTGGTAMSWLAGTTQTGYSVVLFLPTGVTVPPTLPASATSYFDARTFPGTTCYLLVPTGPGGALGRSDLLCWLLNSRTPTGAAQNFTMRLDQSNVATFTWSGPLGGGQSGYQLVPLGSTPIDLPGTATSTTHTLTAPTCYALITQQGGIPSGLTDVVCGFTGVASL